MIKSLRVYNKHSFLVLECSRNFDLWSWSCLEPFHQNNTFNKSRHSPKLAPEPLANKKIPSETLSQINSPNIFPTHWINNFHEFHVLYILLWHNTSLGGTRIFIQRKHTPLCVCVVKHLWRSKQRNKHNLYTVITDEQVDL